MRCQRYSIVMKTPLGGRQGMMMVFFNGSRINGEMELLQQKVPFEGEICENGRCEISGCLKTLMKTINYKACGTITPKNLVLNFEGEHAKLKIKGESLGAL